MLEKKEPIYCNRCGNRLALANLDDLPLCPGCLTQAISMSDDSTITGKITPLFKISPRLGNLAKCRNSQLAPQVSTKIAYEQRAYK